MTDSERNRHLARTAGSSIVTAIGIAVGRHGDKATSARMERAALDAAKTAQGRGAKPDEVRRLVVAAAKAARG